MKRNVYELIEDIRKEKNRTVKLEVAELELLGYDIDEVIENDDVPTEITLKLTENMNPDGDFSITVRIFFDNDEMGLPGGFNSFGTFDGQPQLRELARYWYKKFRKLNHITKLPEVE